MEDADDWEPLFADATPIEQDDGPVPVVKIDYAPEFERVMGYCTAEEYLRAAKAQA